MPFYTNDEKGVKILLGDSLLQRLAEGHKIGGCASIKA
jgi:hypothetical protein